MSSKNSLEECYIAASDIEAVLSLGSMEVKAFTFSGQAPEDAVSGDGIHVGLGGYLWRPEKDEILLDIGPPRLGKAKRGKSPDPISGDFGEALSSEGLGNSSARLKLNGEESLRSSAGLLLKVGAMG